MNSVDPKPDVPGGARMRVKLSTHMDDPGSNSKVTVENAPALTLNPARRAWRGGVPPRKRPPQPPQQQHRPATHGGQGHSSTPIYLLAASQDDVREAAIHIFNATKSRAQHETIGKESFRNLCRRLWLVTARIRRVASRVDGQQDDALLHDSAECSQNIIDSEWLGATMGNTQPLAHRRFLLWFTHTVWRWGLKDAPETVGLSPSDQVRKLIELTQNITPQLLSSHGLSLRTEAAISRSFHENAFSHFDTLASVSPIRRAASANSLRLNPRKSPPRERPDASPQAQIHVTSLELDTRNRESNSTSPNRFIQHLLDTQNASRMERGSPFLEPLEYGTDGRGGIVLSRPTTSGSIQNLHPGRPELSRQQSQNLAILNRRKHSLSESISAFPVTPWAEHESSYEFDEGGFQQIDRNIGSAVDDLIASKLSRPEATAKTASVVDLTLGTGVALSTMADPLRRKRNDRGRQQQRKAKKKKKKKKKKMKKKKMLHKNRTHPSAMSDRDRVISAAAGGDARNTLTSSNRNHSYSLVPAGPERDSSTAPLHRVTVDVTGLARHARHARGGGHGGRSTGHAGSVRTCSLYASRLPKHKLGGPGLMYLNKTRGRNGNVPSFDAKFNANIDGRLRAPHQVPLSMPSLTDDPREVVYQRQRQVLVDHRLEHENKMLMITGGVALGKQHDALIQVNDSIDTTQSAILDMDASINSLYGDKDRLRTLPTRQRRNYQSRRERALSEALGRDHQGVESGGGGGRSSVLDRREGKLLQDIDKLEEHARAVLGPQEYADVRLRLPKPANSNKFGHPSVAELLIHPPEAEHLEAGELAHVARLLRIANASERKMYGLQKKNLQLRNRMLELVREGPVRTDSLGGQQQQPQQQQQQWRQQNPCQQQQQPPFKGNDHAFVNAGRAYAIHNPRLQEDGVSADKGDHWSIHGARKRFSPPRKLRTAGSSKQK